MVSVSRANRLFRERAGSAGSYQTLVMPESKERVSEPVMCRVNVVADEKKARRKLDVDEGKKRQTQASVSVVPCPCSRLFSATFSFFLKYEPTHLATSFVEL